MITTDGLVRMSHSKKNVLWWGRFDPGYSRNRILQSAFKKLGWAVRTYRPKFSALGYIESFIHVIDKPDLVFVPCFRQRDIAAAATYCKHNGIKLMIDPLISAFDKQVNERSKFSAVSPPGRKLREYESYLFQQADILLADTAEHAQFFIDELQVTEDKVYVVYVGAEDIFQPADVNKSNHKLTEILFFGSFIQLHGANHILQAARLVDMDNVRWIMLGDGEERDRLEREATDLKNIVFEKSIAYEKLPGRILSADILLGIFGDTPKASRVIPNKVYQSLACGKPVITRSAPAYPAQLRDNNDHGITWVPAANPEALAQAVREMLMLESAEIIKQGHTARKTFEYYFSFGRIVRQLESALTTQT